MFYRKQISYLFIFLVLCSPTKLYALSQIEFMKILLELISIKSQFQNATEEKKIELNTRLLQISKLVFGSGGSTPNPPSYIVSTDPYIKSFCKNPLRFVCSNFNYSLSKSELGGLASSNKYEVFNKLKAVDENMLKTHSTLFGRAKSFGQKALRFAKFALGWGRGGYTQASSNAPSYVHIGNQEFTTYVALHELGHVMDFAIGGRKSYGNMFGCIYNNQKKMNVNVKVQVAEREIAADYWAGEGYAKLTFINPQSLVKLIKNNMQHYCGAGGDYYGSGAHPSGSFMISFIGNNPRLRQRIGCQTLLNQEYPACYPENLNLPYHNPSSSNPQQNTQQLQRTVPPVTPLLHQGHL